MKNKQEELCDIIDNKAKTIIRNEEKEKFFKIKIFFHKEYVVVVV